MDVRDGEGARPSRDREKLADSALAAPAGRRDRHLARVRRVETAAHEQGVRLASQRRANALGIEALEPAAERPQKRALRRRGEREHAAPRRQARQPPERDLLQSDDVRLVLGDEAHHPLEVRAARRRRRSAVKEVPGAKDEPQSRTSLRSVHVLLVDPGAFTPPYDHELAAALARRGADVELVTSPFRFGDAPTPDGYRRRELFYPRSSRLFRRSPLRLPLKGAEHALGLLRLRGVSADVVHVQWAPLPQLDIRLLPLRGPSVITAHDILPRRSAARRDLWRRLYARFDRVVAHSERGRERLVGEGGVDPAAGRVVPAPPFPGTPRYEDDGRTLLFLGVIRPYKQLEHALAVARELDARLLVVGDPAVDVSRWRAEAGVEWRLGFVPEAEIDRALAETTVALFPYREELDASGALMRCLGAGVPAVAYDVGGIAEPVRRFGEGAAVPPDDRAALAEAASRLLSDPAALEDARAGAR